MADPSSIRPRSRQSSTSRRRLSRLSSKLKRAAVARYTLATPAMAAPRLQSNTCLCPTTICPCSSTSLWTSRPFTSSIHPPPLGPPLLDHSLHTALASAPAVERTTMRTKKKTRSTSRSASRRLMRRSIPGTRTKRLMSRLRDKMSAFKAPRSRFADRPLLPLTRD